MADKIITFSQVEKWFSDLEESLKDRLVNTALDDKQGREELYNLYQAAQLLQARMLGDKQEIVEFNNTYFYDEG